MILKINDKEYNIPKFSDLTVNEYIKISELNKDINVISYLECFVDVDIHNSDVSSNISVAELESLLFDVNLDYTKIEMPNVFNDLLVKDIDKGAKFGARYYFSKYHKECSAGKISITELCVRALAISLDYEKQDEIFKGLMNRKWIEVLPLGFFFTQKFTKSKSSIRKTLALLTARLSLFLIRGGMWIKYKWTVSMQR